MFSRRLDWQCGDVDSITEDSAGVWVFRNRGGYIIRIVNDKLYSIFFYILFSILNLELGLVWYDAVTVTRSYATIESGRKF